MQMFTRAKQIGLAILVLMALAVLVAPAPAQSASGSPGAPAVSPNPSSSVPLYLAGTTVGPGPALVTQSMMCCCCCCCCYYYYQPTPPVTPPVTTPPVVGSPSGGYTKQPSTGYTKQPSSGYTKPPSSGYTKPPTTSYNKASTTGHSKTTTGSSHPSSPGRTSMPQPQSSMSLNPLMARNLYMQAAGASARANLSAALASLYAGNSLPRAGAGLGGLSGLPTEDAYGSYLRGNADLTDALGTFRNSQAQAHELRASVTQQQAETRRQAFEEYLYERKETPTRQDEQELSHKHELRRSQNDPPVTEVCSAKALNDLLAHLQDLQAKGAGGEPIALEQAVLKRIHLMAAKGDGQVSVLHDGGRLDYPAALRKDAFQTERAELDRLAPVAVQEAINGRVSAATLRNLRGAVDALNRRVVAEAGNMPPARYIEAKRFVNRLGDALKVLEQPDGGNYFTGKYAAQGKTVADLVRHMTERGLLFAPAAAGDEAAYLALHRALAASTASAQAELVARH
jgi:hypothetical protein